MRQPKHLFLFSNGNVAAFDENDEQIPELQLNGWLILWLEHLQQQGINIDHIERIETIVNGRLCRIEPFKNEYGWSYRIIDATTSENYVISKENL